MSWSGYLSEVRESVGADRRRLAERRIKLREEAGGPSARFFKKDREGLVDDLVVAYVEAEQRICSPREQLDGRAPSANGEEPTASSQLGDAGSIPASRSQQEGGIVGVLDAVFEERDRVEAICEQKRRDGEQWFSCADPRMSNGDKLAVLMEEVGEVAEELCEARAADVEPSPNLRTELIQVAAVAAAWATSIEVDELAARS